MRRRLHMEYLPQHSRVLLRQLLHRGGHLKRAQQPHRKRHHLIHSNLEPDNQTQRQWLLIPSYNNNSSSNNRHHLQLKMRRGPS